MLLVRTLRELLIKKDVFTADEVRRAIERMDARSPTGGAKMVAHDWVDPSYRGLMLADGLAAAEELGVEVGSTKLIVV